MKLKMTKSSGNVFRDIGFPREEAEHLLVCADLMIQVQNLITSRRLKQKATAQILGVTQPHMSERHAHRSSTRDGAVNTPRGLG